MNTNVGNGPKGGGGGGGGLQLRLQECSSSSSVGNGLIKTHCSTC